MFLSVLSNYRKIKHLSESANFTLLLFNQDQTNFPKLQQTSSILNEPYITFLLWDIIHQA